MAFAKYRSRKKWGRILTIAAIVLIIAGFSWRLADAIGVIIEARADRASTSSPSPSSDNTVEGEGIPSGDEVEGSYDPGQACDLVMSEESYAAFAQRMLDFGEIRMMADGAQKLEAIKPYVSQDYLDFYVPPVPEESDLDVRNVFDREATQTQCFIESADATVLLTTMVPSVTTYGIVDGTEVVLQEPSSDTTYQFVWTKLDGIWYVNQEQ
jgi:hypothetical protein